MSVILDNNPLRTAITDMKRDETPLMTQQRLAEAKALGEKLARLRRARHIRQSEAALRAGLSRATAVLIEQGDIRRTQAQILRYLEAIAPGLPLLSLLLDEDPALQALKAREATQRVRVLRGSDLKELDF